MLQISGQKVFKKSLQSHSEHLSTLATFLLYDTSPEEMSTIWNTILESPSMKRILKTKSSETNGGLLIETTKTKQ